MYFIRCMSHRCVMMIEILLLGQILTSLCKVPPFSSQSAVQILSAAICVLFQDWLEAEKHTPGGYFPAGRIDSAMATYLGELQAGDAQRATREGYERVRRELRRFW
jgi:nuclear pore complex protein Nup155